MKNTKLIGLFISLLTLASCSDDTTNTSANADNSSTAESAIVATIAADYSSGAHSVISKDADGIRTALNELDPTDSDITVVAYGSHFYRIGRAFAGNNITKFSSSDVQTPIWQYSTNDVDGAVLSNPYDMVFASETKAYILRNGSNIAWIVNPSASVAAEFKIGELDLSAYADADGIPEMASGVIADGKLYVTLQRLENYAVTQDAYVAIFDINTDLEMDANIEGDTLKGIPLQTRNPGNIIYEPASNSIYVQGTGSFWPEEFTGGIENIDLTTFSTTVIVDDGDAVTHPYGLITELAVVSDSVLYFVGYAAWADNTLYKLDLTTSEITATDVVSLISSQIASLSVDAEGLLWVSDSANATVRIIDPATDTEVDALYTSLNPEKVVFVQ